MPSSTDASRNSRANSRFRRSRANPTFQSLLRLAMAFRLQVILPKVLRATNVFRLRRLAPPDEQNDDRRAVKPPQAHAQAGSQRPGLGRTTTASNRGDEHVGVEARSR